MGMVAAALARRDAPVDEVADYGLYRAADTEIDVDGIRAEEVHCLGSHATDDHVGDPVVVQQSGKSSRFVAWIGETFLSDDRTIFNSEEDVPLAVPEVS